MNNASAQITNKQTFLKDNSALKAVVYFLILLLFFSGIKHDKIVKKNSSGNLFVSCTLRTRANMKQKTERRKQNKQK